MWIAVISIIFLLLVYIGVRPLLPPLPFQRKRMTLAKLTQWICDNAEKATQSIDIMSAELPPEVYDKAVEVLKNKDKVKVRILTSNQVLCRSKRRGNGLVELATSGKPNIELRTMGNVPKNHLKIFDNQVSWKEFEHPLGYEQQYRDGHIFNELGRTSLCKGDFDYYWERAVKNKPTFILPEELKKMAEVKS